mmetsp:Transcript_11643/g.47077  ORF Transcript_11643/g.47077 Transcript_11643/m.47077 type:complete len:170 (+) Transcript_11643:426-935(+)
MIDPGARTVLDVPDQVVVSKDRRVLSMGYNGFFAGAPHESIVARGHEQATVHAEQNAISHAARSGIALDGASAYVTHYPCINCYKALVSAGIKQVYYIDDYRNDAVVAELARVSGVAVAKLCAADSDSGKRVVSGGGAASPLEAAAAASSGGTDSSAASDASTSAAAAE